jgi:hypothetical protein
MPKALVVSALFLCLISSMAQGQNSGDAHPRPSGAVLAGAAQFNVLSPGDIQINNGQVFGLKGEKGFGFWHLYIEALFEYFKSTGTLNYNYQGPSGVTYTANQVTFGFEKYFGGLGLRWKITQSTPIKPYLEVGGGAGYTQISYDSSLRAANLLARGSDYKTFDSTLDFAQYGEAGVEVGLVRSFGVVIAARYMDCTMRPLETLRKQSPHYTTLAYYGGLYANF